MFKRAKNLIIHHYLLENIRKTSYHSTREVPLTHRCLHKRNPLNTMNNQDDEVVQKENKKSSENKLRDIEIRDLNDREFKITVQKKLN